MRLIFLGTPAFAVATLEAVVKAGHEVAAVLTQPDRPRGRGQNAAASPVKQTALALGLTVYQPERVRRSEEHTSELQSLRHLVCRLLLEKKKKPTHHYPVRADADTHPQPRARPRAR